MAAFEMLKADYVDAVFDGLRKYMQIINQDGTFSFADVTQYTVKEGSFLGAKDINMMNTAINLIMAALNNGTDLYEVFTNFFVNQQELFENTAEIYNADFLKYVDELKKVMDAQWGIMSNNYIVEINRFENTQEALFNTWFEMMKNRLSNDAAGNLQLQVTELTEKIDSLHNMLLDGYVNGYLYVNDDEGNGHLLSSAGYPILLGQPICKCKDERMV